ncbi:MAG: ATP-dependent endonuclease [Puniceicoccaceae bacterium]|nr:ATP-dependent endonuclease [Puniceicoccaceae bacterium]|tara:strand:+ start:28961 stop:31147 length:2187 start_codon:yes stop_codon:yes gene_type:complete
MRINHFTIRNFRKLKESKIELSDKETIFVGANNSGKTSAMDALIKFLSKDNSKRINTTDVTLCNWQVINKIGSDWAAQDENPIEIQPWRTLLPSLDIWIHVETSQIHRVSHLIPSLDWPGGNLGVRMQLEPTDEYTLEELYTDFRNAEKAARETTTTAQQNEGSTFSLWPKTMRDFLDKKLHEYFSIRCYLLDPANPTQLPENHVPLDRRPFDELFRIHVINAQRGFSDNSSDEPNKHKLAEQLRAYYDKHLNPSDMPDANDVTALKAIHDAQVTFDGKLEESFKPALADLSEMNYPGFLNPDIILTSQLSPVDALTHKSGIQFSVPVEDTETSADLMRLPENYNGLGYQNLISMLFQLVRFRDEWMRIGKASKSETANEPLQLVLIEEPEAHLHAQAQQVFIKKAYAILRKGIPEHLKTQLVVSTHSSHIAYETEFTSLRYFKRKAPSKELSVPCAEVVNLSTVFGDDEETLKFAKRYLKTTHCDLFFADAAILVEGQAERLLIPHFILKKYPNLNKSYATILEIGGSHAHRLKPLIEALGLYTLIISDLDSIEAVKSTKVQPERGKKYRSGNDTLKKWFPLKSDQDELLDLPAVDKITENGQVRVSYQCPFEVEFNGKKEEAIPYTFEDALALSNIELFKTHAKDSTGMLKKMCDAAAKTEFSTACKEMYDALSGVKAKMALDVLFNIDPSLLTVPQYVDEGLQWLEEKFTRNIAPKTAPSTKEAE